MSHQDVSFSSPYRRHSHHKSKFRPRQSYNTPTSIDPSVPPSVDTALPPVDPKTEIDVTLSTSVGSMIKPSYQVNVPAARWRARSHEQAVESTKAKGSVSDSSDEVIMTRKPELGSWRSRAVSASATDRASNQTRPIVKPDALPNHVLQPVRRESKVTPATPISPTKDQTSSVISDPTLRATPTQALPDVKYLAARRASVPIALASFPHASVPSIPYTQMPDLNRIRPIAPYRVAEQMLITEPCQLPRTKEFALAPPPYSDDDIPPPEPYNEAYPHPLTSYASPGVNPNAVLLSGYDLDLAKLMESNRSKALGTILATCDRPGITAPTLAKHLRSYIPDGNGIPGFDNEGAARAALGPVGAAMCRGDERLSELTGGGGSGIQPVFTPAISHVPPRHAAQARMETRLPTRDQVPSMRSGYEYPATTPPLSPGFERRSSTTSQQSDYFAIPAHPASMRRLSVVSASDTDQQYSTMSSYEQSQRGLYSPAPKIHSASLATSPWYKTELCPAHQETGQCRYGLGCQFGHGLQELRLGLGRSSFEMRDQIPATFEQSQAPTSAALPKIDIRRASAPHSQLPTVAEVDDDHYHSFNNYISGRRSSEATEVPPAGFERFIRSDSIARDSTPRQVSNRDLSSSMSSDMPWTPTNHISNHQPSSNPYGHHLVARASDSSISSTGYSPGRESDDYVFTGFPSSDPNYTSRPISGQFPTRHGGPDREREREKERDTNSGSSWGSRSPGRAGQVNTSSTTVEFSAGRSIWC